MDGDRTFDEAVAAQRAAGDGDGAGADDAVDEQGARTDGGDAGVSVRARQHQLPCRLLGHAPGSADRAGVGQVLDAIEYKRSAVVHDAADDRSRLAGISLADHQRARADGCRAGISVVGHEPDGGGGRVGDGDPARAGDDVEEGFAGAAVEFEGCAGAG